VSAGRIEGRFARFRSRPDVADVASRYGDWAVSDEGIGINLRLALIAMSRVHGHLPRPAYRVAVRKLAATTTVPLRDFLILAECQLELLRSALGAAGLISFTPSKRGPG
jgi:hypothetical protein